MEIENSGPISILVSSNTMDFPEVCQAGALAASGGPSSTSTLGSSSGRHKRSVAGDIIPKTEMRFVIFEI